VQVDLGYPADSTPPQLITVKNLGDQSLRPLGPLRPLP